MGRFCARVGSPGAVWSTLVQKRGKRESLRARFMRNLLKMNWLRFKPLAAGSNTVAALCERRLRRREWPKLGGHRPPLQCVAFLNERLAFSPCLPTQNSKPKTQN